MTTQNTKGGVEIPAVISLIMGTAGVRIWSADDSLRHKYPDDVLHRYVLAAPTPAHEIAEQPMGEDAFVIRRGGAFFRPDAAGYTIHIIAAGIYSRAEADRYAEVEGVTIHALADYREDADVALAGAQRILAALTPKPAEQPETGEGVTQERLVNIGYREGYEYFRNKWIGDHEEMIVDMVRCFVPRAPSHPTPAGAAMPDDAVDRQLSQAINERDEAEAALSDAYRAVCGREPEWSNNFHYREAINDMRDASSVQYSDNPEAQSASDDQILEQHREVLVNTQSALAMRINDIRKAKDAAELSQYDPLFIRGYRAGIDKAVSDLTENAK